MYNTPYINYSPQASIDRLNSQISELERLKAQIQNNSATLPNTGITQNFQLAPTNTGDMKYANSIAEVEKISVFNDTPFFSKDLSICWLKNAKGEIKSYELREIVQKDEKDLKIDYLVAQINELKGMINNEPVANANATITNASEEQKPTNVSTISKPNAKSK